VAQKLGFNSADVAFADGQVVSGNRKAPLGEAASDGEIVAEDAIEYGDLAKTHQQSTFGAHFVEVGVDTATAEIRGAPNARRLWAAGESSTRSPREARSSAP